MQLAGTPASNPSKLASSRHLEAWHDLGGLATYLDPQVLRVRFDDARRAGMAAHVLRPVVDGARLVLGHASGPGEVPTVVAPDPAVGVDQLVDVIRAMPNAGVVEVEQQPGRVEVLAADDAAAGRLRDLLASTIAGVPLQVVARPPVPDHRFRIVRDAAGRATSITAETEAARALLEGIAGTRAKALVLAFARGADATGRADVQQLRVGGVAWNPYVHAEFRDGVVQLLPARSLEFLDLVAGRTTDPRRAGQLLATLRHEAQHAVTPMPTRRQRWSTWVEEGSAELLAAWPGRIEQMGSDVGIDVAAPGDRPYVPFVRRLSALLGAAGIDAARPDHFQRAVELLQRVEHRHVPRAIAKAIVASAGADGSLVDRVEARIATAANFDDAERFDGATRELLDEIGRLVARSG